MQSTLGRSKVEVLAEMLRDINPAVELTVMREGIGPENVTKFFEGVDVYVDGIDFFEIAARRLVFRTARQQGIYAITAAPLGFGATLQVFSPTGMSFDDYCGISDSMSSIEQVAAFAAGLAPHPYHTRYLDFTYVNFSTGKGPAVSPACTLAASFVATEVVKIVTGKGRIKPVPHYVQVDLLLNKHTRGYLFLGGRNPFQVLKRRIILGKFKSGR
jgi:molybdopterin/thiamine biosynthesis adenylyltransferase